MALLTCTAVVSFDQQCR